MRRMIGIVGVVATALLATVGQAQTIDVSEASGDYSFTIFDDDGVAQTGNMTLNFGRSGALAGSFDGEELSFGSWERCGDTNVLVTFGNEIPDNSITVVGTLAEGTDGLAIRGHSFQSQFVGSVEGAFQALHVQ